MHERQACLMANHGMVACGRDLSLAMWRAVELEAVALQYQLALAAGGAVLLSRADMDAARVMFTDYRPA